jgi:hypothetical protein
LKFTYILTIVRGGEVLGQNLEDEYHGSSYRIVHCKGALDSLNVALDRVPKHKQKSFIRGLSHQINRLANGHKMSSENFPKEGELPKCNGGEKNGHFHAFKKKPVRGYCWRSKRFNNTYFISHYVLKDYQKLKERDTQIVAKNWHRIEESGDEF